ncbi:subtilase family protein [Mobilisporobacter senegalensis]|uniref:Subtilase family protein n=1 Tax=Mobilisporobacter senegalensis TaxID=1329262 RepID=A0A3N1XNP9_9FIRM|nr:S8 family serine peptidase [Mobilisporobacter senegalensis]ROR28313.1 subtilase family protein [Mobilisporobacter senegalensis]
MDSGKVSNDLNLALDVNDQVREKSADLNVGYIEEDNSWELIVKYSGDINRIREEMQIQITELISGYATVTIPQSRIAQFISYPEIEFVEKPRRLTFAVSAGRAASCINPVQTAEFDLFGDGVLVAIIDSGIDYTHPDFRNEDGTSRILDLWDQTIPGTPPIGYTVGTLYTKAMLDEALSRRTVPERLEIVPSVDISGHGTHVTCLKNIKVRYPLRIESKLPELTKPMDFLEISQMKIIYEGKIQSFNESSLYNITMLINKLGIS